MSNESNGYLNVAVEGCCHGELDVIYDTIRTSERQSGVKIDLLLVCGDFQSIRDENDMRHIAVPEKYRTFGTFRDYVTGIKAAPVMTIFIGGNHEASNYLQTLYYGGFVAPNIYFLGYAGVVWYGGVRIAGISGIYNEYNYRLGHHEKPPYNDSTIRSIYHIRELEVHRLAHLQHKEVDIFLSHEWPQGIWEYGNKQQLLRVKPYFAADISNGTLGGGPLMSLMQTIRPKFWFSAHLHVKFAAVYPHSESGVSPATGVEAGYCVPSVPCANVTRFLALDKVIPGRDFLQVLRIKRQRPGKNEIEYDPYWLAILKKTHYLLHASKQIVRMPDTPSLPSSEEISEMSMRLSLLPLGSTIPNIGVQSLNRLDFRRDLREGNIQTDRIVDILGVDHIWTIPSTPELPDNRTSTFTDIGDNNNISDLVNTADVSDKFNDPIVDIRNEIPALVDENEIDIDI